MDKLRILIIMSLVMLSSQVNAVLLDPTKPVSIPANAKFNMNFWQLNAILFSRDRSSAVINDQVVRTGDKLLGYRVTHIARDYVILSGPRGRVTLFLLNGSVKRALD